MSENFVVYTAIFGDNGDTILPLPPAVPPGIDFVAFTDHVYSQRRVGGWDIRPPAFSSPQDKRRLARRHKLLPHELFPQAPGWLWIDGSMQLTGDLSAFLTAHHSAPLYGFRHSERSCVYAEAHACVRLGKDKESTIAAQMRRYAAEDYPTNAGLVETGILLRWNRPAVRWFNADWWAEVEKGSCRDQLSFNYCLTKRSLTMGFLSGSVYRNTCFRHVPHHRAKKGI